VLQFVDFFERLSHSYHFGFESADFFGYEFESDESIGDFVFGFPYDSHCSLSDLLEQFEFSADDRAGVQ